MNPTEVQPGLLPRTNRTQLLSAKEVGQMLALHRTRIYDLIKYRNFPRPIKLGSQTSRWRLDEVENWLAEIEGDSAGPESKAL